ncbi:ABC transporter substrate-binding protein [Borborobacter arsenicus]|nr:ABC transporter substrate-binding protein [Pseudaminobacter arsenicus]
MTDLRLLFKHEMIALDPNGFNSDSSSATVVLKMVCQSLVKFDHDGLLAPDLALNWTISPDWTRFTFELDPAARFHSGRRCDSEAVAACFTNFLHPATNSLLAHDYAGLERIEVLSSSRIAFQFSSPTTSFLKNLAWRTHIVDDTQRQPVGTGPFRLVRWQRGEGIWLERFDGDRTEHPGNVTSARIRFAPQIEERLAVVRRGEADLVESLPGVAAAPLAEQGLITLHSAPAQQKATICFNCRAAPFKDPRVRFAFAHAIDRKPLAQTFGGAGSSVVDDLLSDPDLAPDVESLQFDPERAKWLLTQAGYGAGLTLRAAATNVAPVPGLAAAVAAGLAAIGVSLVPTFYDDPPWWPYTYLKGPWDLAFQSSPGRPHPDTLFSRELRSGGPFNAGGYGNPRVDELMDAARACTDPDQQRGLYVELQRLVRMDLPVLVLFSSAVTVGWRDSVTGFAPHPMGVVDISTVDVSGH